MASALVTKLIFTLVELIPSYQDMVDATLFNQAEPQLSADTIIKIVLGSINSTLDNRDFPSPLFLN